ncbi:MAG: hypothetical protein Q8T09_11185 [Candidatus Melainabacteria bacterium]|nr:hypothetical protein [Candidatus Melainabacteria bacterium]
MNNLNNKTNQQYGLSPSHFAIGLTGVLFICMAIGTAIIGITGYNAEGFRLCSFWTIGLGSLTWLFVCLAPDDETAKETR